MLAITMVYGDIGGFERFWVVKNKAKQSQFNPENRGKDSFLVDNLGTGTDGLSSIDN